MFAVTPSLINLILLAIASVSMIGRHTNFIETLAYQYSELEHQYIELCINFRDIERELINVRNAIDDLDTISANSGHTDQDVPQFVVQQDVPPFMAQSAAPAWQDAAYQMELLLLQTAQTTNRLPQLLVGTPYWLSIQSPQGNPQIFLR